MQIFIDDKDIMIFFGIGIIKMKNMEILEPRHKNSSKILLTFVHLYQDHEILEKIQFLGQRVAETIENGGKVFLLEMGGSFADAQHLSSEFICKLNSDRNPLPSVALGTNTSSITAIGNDYGFEYIFSRELEAIGNVTFYWQFLLVAKAKIYKCFTKVKEMEIPRALLTGPKKY